ncbi:SAM-dependent methyltransferase [Streptomyces sp. NPDC088725]|uniref:SAM-dependent methyltransferase n=1 Tax=Streptomyces sp. NPDC088725 TaxID=3365873 RepID=UPI00380676F1
MADHTVSDDTRPDDTRPDDEIWDELYSGSEQRWSGNPNAILVREVTGTEPGRALDLGCGEGGDAIWLAREGWRVTATDVSRVALDRAARHAAEAGVADRIDWQQHDFTVSFPGGVYDLVSAQFLHSLGGMSREKVLRTAVPAVAPGGVLLVVGHAGSPSWEHHAHPEVRFPTPEEVLDDLDLAEGEWEVLICEEHPRTQAGPDGQPTTRTDNTVKVRRLSA